MRPKHLLALALALLCTATFAQSKKAKAPSGSSPDKAHLQNIWDAWATLNPANPAPFYESGPHTFFDLAPLKYSSWDEYQKGVTALLANYQSAKFAVNDDAEIHTTGNISWGSATVKSDMVTKGGKHEMSTFRWTFVFEKHDGKWLLVHEHVSAPLS